MPTAEAQVPTDRASRYLVQLCRHTAQMSRMRHRPPTRHGGEQTPPEVQRVEFCDTHGTVHFAGGQWTLKATPDALTLRVEADDEDTLERLRTGITARLEKIGRRDQLEVLWQRSPAPGAAGPAPSGEAGSTAPAPAAEAGKPRRRGKTIGMMAGGALIVAVHLGLGGAALAASAWTGWAANTVLVVVLLKVVFMGGHVVLGRLAIRRGRTFTTFVPSLLRHRPPEPASTPSPATEIVTDKEYT